METEKCPMPPFLVILVGVIAVSFSAIFIKWSNAPASILGMYRLLFTVLLMTPFMVPHLKEIGQLRGREWGLLCLSGLFLGLHFLLWIDSLKLTTIASSMILTSLEPVFVMVGAFLLFKERTNRMGILSMVVAIVGTIWIAWGDLGMAGNAILGDVLSVLGTVAVSVYMLAGQNLRLRMSSSVYNYLVFLIATIVFAVYNVAKGYSWVGYSGKEWGIFLLLAVVPTVLGHALFNWLLKYVNATTISMSILGEPIGAILLSFILLHDSIRWFQLVGGLITISGVWLFLRSKSSETASQSHHEPSSEVLSMQQ